MAEDYLVALDIGSSKVTAIVGEKKETGEIEIIGIGKSISRGLRNGSVVNLEQTAHSITTAISEADVMAGIEIVNVWLGIAGGHINSKNERGMTTITGPNKEITGLDIERVIESARAVAMPFDKEIIHSIPRDFCIDGQSGIKAPIGMTGLRLEADVHIVTGAVSSAQNIIKSVNKAGHHVVDIILNPLASSLAVLGDDEKELGVILVDIGGGTIDIAIYINGSICYTKSLILGGENITKDISYGLRTNIEEAEKIKIRYGKASINNYNDDDEIEISGLGANKSRKIKVIELGKIIEPRVIEIFSLIKEQIEQSGYLNSVATGVVLTGGTAELEGIQELAETILDLPVRIGTPKGITGLSDILKGPQFATSVGLIKWIAEEYDTKTGYIEGTNIFTKILNSLKDAFNELFF